MTEKCKKCTNIFAIAEDYQEQFENFIDSYDDMILSVINELAWGSEVKYNSEDSAAEKLNFVLKEILPYLSNSQIWHIINKENGKLLAWMKVEKFCKEIQEINRW